MAIQINKNANATLTAQAVAGGSLLQNTTYYVCVIFSRYSTWREGKAHGNISNEVSVTTTTTDLSIQLNYSWAVSITAFADDGGGVVRVTTDGLHCMANGDSIDITGTTNYNGTYTITYDESDIDGTDAPNEFRITATWVSNDATGTATCDDNVIGSNIFWSIRCSLSQAWVSGEWDASIIDGTDWIGNGYGLVAASQGYTLTTKPTISGSGVVDFLPYFRKSGKLDGITDYDRPYFKVTASETFANITDALEAWLPENSVYFLPGLVGTQVPSLHVQAHMYFASLTGPTTITNKNFTIDGSLQTNNPTTAKVQLTWNYVNYRQYGCRRPETAGTFNNCAVRDECSDSPYFNKATFNDSTFAPSSSITFYGNDNGTFDGGVASFVLNTRYFWYVYPELGTPQTRIENLIILNGYFYLYQPRYDCSIAADTHYMENIDINSNSTTRDLYLLQTSARTIELLNVRAPLQTNAIPRFYRSNALYGSFRSYFTVNIRVLDNAGTPISGATVSMTDTLSNVTSDTTDINGDVALIVRSYDNDPGALVTGTLTNYNPFTLSITHGSYAPYTSAGLSLYDKLNNTVALQPLTGGGGTTIYGSTLYGSTIQ